MAAQKSLTATTKMMICGNWPHVCGFTKAQNCFDTIVKPLTYYDKLSLVYYFNLRSIDNFLTALVSE